MIARLLLALVLALPAVARAQDLPLVAALSQTAVEVSTGFTGASLMVFGSTEGPIGPGGDEVLVVARGPTRPIVVRRKVSVAGLIWVNGPSARFAQVPGFYFISGTRPAWQLLPEDERQRNSLGLDSLPLTSTGARSPAFRAALLGLESQSGLWIEDASAVEIAGSRLFHARLPLPAAVPTGDYQVEVLLVRSRRIVARQELAFRVDRVGTADRIATVAEDQPFLYGIACIVFAALAGWLGSVLFRRG
ncbi:TIGR02186 family protein [Belnapia sp. T6]|uniref:TIGR02186 family protein n=1 Tax=Belnapia mucosa TaxID=2804532 RepID=A0ABS1V5Q8_9PROT|nr:TIGR02186 family protein [Belnapia mucosa]MBL6457006.1 TIGR02186 family protein [Belnapia mucosa]